MVQAPTFRKECQHEAYKEEVERLLECFRGVAKATNRRTISFLFAFLVPILEDCVPLFELYNNCPETVEILLSLLLDVVESHLGSLSKVSEITFYRRSLLCVYRFCTSFTTGDIIFCMFIFQSDSRRLQEICVRLMEVYSKHSLGKYINRDYFMVMMMMMM